MDILISLFISTFSLLLYNLFSDSTSLYCIVLYCIVLCCTVLFWTRLYCTEQYCSIQSRGIVLCYLLLFANRIIWWVRSFFLVNSKFPHPFLYFAPQRTSWRLWRQRAAQMNPDCLKRQAAWPLILLHWSTHHAKIQQDYNLIPRINCCIRLQIAKMILLWRYSKALSHHRIFQKHKVHDLQAITPRRILAPD